MNATETLTVIELTIPVDYYSTTHEAARRLITAARVEATYTITRDAWCTSDAEVAFAADYAAIRALVELLDPEEADYIIEAAR